MVHYKSILKVIWEQKLLKIFLGDTILEKLDDRIF